MIVHAQDWADWFADQVASLAAEDSDCIATKLAQRCRTVRWIMEEHPDTTEDVKVSVSLCAVLAVSAARKAGWADDAIRIENTAKLAGIL